MFSSDACRAMVSDDENNQAASADAFELARCITSIRLKNGLLTVIDATNVQEESRRDWIKLAREHHFLPVAIILNMSERVCADRNAFKKRPGFWRTRYPAAHFAIEAWFQEAEI